MNIDRITPTLRPTPAMGRVAQHQTWRDLLFLHWRVPVSVLRPLIPPALEIDTFAGDAFVGLVPFTMRDVRLPWAPPLPGLSSFHETNVRTYVHFEGRDPGVWFFSLDAANRLAAWIARTFWHLPYHHAAMSLEQLADGSIRYRSDRLAPPPMPARCDITYRATGAPSAAIPGTLEHFLAERYVLYADVGDGELRLGRVHHRPYPLQAAALIHWEESLLLAAGIARGTGEPLAHFASGVEVEVFGLERLRVR